MVLLRSSRRLLAAAAGQAPPSGAGAAAAAGSGAFVVPSSRIDYGRVRVDVTGRADLLQQLADEQRRFFETNVPAYFDREGITEPKTLRERIARYIMQTRALKARRQQQDYGTRIGITIMNHINNEDWAMLFGIKELYMEVTCWLWVIHLWLVQKRMWPVPDSIFINRHIMRVFKTTSERRYRDIFDTSMEARKAVGWVGETYNVMLAALDESFHADCQYRDALLLYALYRNSPFEHREEVPFYAWYTLVQYIRLHLAVFDRIPNADYRQGHFFFYHPLDEALFERPAALDKDFYVRDLLRAKRGAKPPEPGAKPDGS
eukprot:TRINITY_DN71720_c0_g1_i1.p1 TRINITY_DN71720_c0_g1~~TRINITY_DN71720_c0_g1_i1.p1  ORF type:complete len:318 (+),score=112.28 TRINITY_DN71720_c0_g1_i1:79-1032(+)